LAQDIPIDDVREWLGLTSWGSCFELSRDQAVSVLRIMAVFRYNETSYFVGLWTLPPLGMKHTDWYDTYGQQVTLKTGKGMHKKIGLCKRVAHYLGFSEPAVAAPAVAAPPVAAPPVAAPPVAGNAFVLSSRSTAEIGILLAYFQAEFDSRNLSATIEVTGESTGATPANPPSNGTQG
jgi:hypothetical protein